ncbi:glycosyltransferase family 4 protein [Magnetovibrio sp. PR-2]|uniref:glycosyltransferase family 4 protein n=1 Tax=Magnetovibrio sp. PR-2 TaxID=3120356 RepID=UPI002FCE07AE
MSVLKEHLRIALNTAKCLPARMRGLVGLSSQAGDDTQVKFIIEDANWAIRWVGEHICEEINALHPSTAKTGISPVGDLNKVVHFGSQYMWLSWGGAAGRSNKYVVSFFHGKYEDGPDVARHIDRFLDSTPRLSRIVVSNSILNDRLVSWGVPSSQIVQIPIGVNMKTFVPPKAGQRDAARAKFNIPSDAVVIGSFQKDGVGWGDGMEPKLIKGPDIFVETLKELKNDFPVFVMLTGPARGYVKARLDEAGIPFAHTYPEDPANLVECYHALDLYIVSSREEGGPMGLMESMSSHVPVVSTNVGMAPDLIEDGVTGGLDLTLTPTGLAQKARDILSIQDRDTLLKKAHVAVSPCDWPIVARRHHEEVYASLIDDVAK